MPSTPRPPTEWLFDDLGRMSMQMAYDFTSGEFFGTDVGIVFALKLRPEDPEDGERRFQLLMKPALASALIEALSEHVANLQRQ